MRSSVSALPHGLARRDHRNRTSASSHSLKIAFYDPSTAHCQLTLDLRDSTVCIWMVFSAMGLPCVLRSYARCELYSKGVLTHSCLNQGRLDQRIEYMLEPQLKRNNYLFTLCFVGVLCVPAIPRTYPACKMCAPCALC